jgi:Leucine-rich repeat (LRR) protein
LESIDASNNLLKTLPQEMHKLKEIQVIDVRCNQLINLPASLSECPKLVTLACDGNSELTQIPESLRENSRLVLWILQKIKGI